MRSRMSVMGSNGLLCVDLQAGKVMTWWRCTHTPTQPSLMWTDWTGYVILLCSLEVLVEKWVTGEVDFFLLESVTFLGLDVIFSSAHKTWPELTFDFHVWSVGDTLTLSNDCENYDLHCARWPCRICCLVVHWSRLLVDNHYFKIKALFRAMNIHDLKKKKKQSVVLECISSWVGCTMVRFILLCRCILFLKGLALIKISHFHRTW